MEEECNEIITREALGQKEKTGKQKKPYWWNKEIEYEMEEKRKKYHKYLISQNINGKLRYKGVQAKVRRNIREKYGKLEAS